MRHLALFTTKVPYHASHSGYEQLIRFLNADDVIFRVRKNADNFWIKNIERALRRITASKWYMWDGVEAEWHTWRKSRKHGDALISHFLYGDNAIGLLPYFNHKLAGKLVLTIHACPSDLGEILQKPKLLKRVDAIVLLGSNQKPFFLKHGIPDHNIHLVPHGVDLTYFTPTENEHFHTCRRKNFEIIMVGNWRRNFPFYRRVAERFLENPHIHFRVISQNHHRFHFEGLPNVTFHSNISDEKLKRMYQSSDVLLLGLQDAVANNVLLEGMACGLPVVVEKVGALPEYVTETAGCYVAPNDDASAARAITSLYQNKELWLQKRTQVLEEVTHFDWNNIAEKLDEVYKIVMAR